MVNILSIFYQLHYFKVTYLVFIHPKCAHNIFTMYTYNNFTVFHVPKTRRKIIRNLIEPRYLMTLHTGLI
jgi:hypothetical protein